MQINLVLGTILIVCGEGLIVSDDLISRLKLADWSGVPIISVEHYNSVILAGESPSEKFEIRNYTSRYDYEDTLVATIDVYEGDNLCFTDNNTGEDICYSNYFINLILIRSDKEREYG